MKVFLSDVDVVDWWKNKASQVSFGVDPLSIKQQQQLQHRTHDNGRDSWQHQLASRSAMPV